MPETPDLEALTQFCTVRQLAVLEAVIERKGSMRGAAKLLGISHQATGGVIKAIQRKAALQGHSPAHDMTKTVPEGFKVRGVSTYYDDAGKVKGQWVKSSADDEQRAAAMAAALAAMCEDVPRSAPCAAVLGTLGHLCNVYTLTDSHVGMLAYGKETLTGDWDLKIAEDTLVGCFAQMIEASPRSTTALVNQLGDFLHYDGLTAVTPLHGNILDADGRFSKMVRAAVRILRRVITLALLKHEKVVVLMAEGNHDPASSVWLRTMFQALYEDEPRVEVIDSDLPYYVHRHGATMLCFHHGHLKKNDQLPILFASQFAEMWGQTLYRYAHTGHRHHVEEKEHSGITITQHATLAARDAYAARGGWIAHRQVTSVTYSDKYGQVARNTVTPEMLEICTHSSDMQRNGG